MKELKPRTLLCLACYFKGVDFLRQAKREGCRVLLVTSQKLADEAWPKESIDEIFLAPESEGAWDLKELVKGVSFLARKETIDRIVALDDFDVEKAALLREHLRLPGMGESQARHFRDKLAMRIQADRAAIPVPAYVALFHTETIRSWTERVPAPWLVKPRSQASATGILKIDSQEALWKALQLLGDAQSNYVLERFIPGTIYHVDSIVYRGRILFARAHVYLDPPMKVAHEGGIFTSMTVLYDSEDEKQLQLTNQQLIEALGLRDGVSHTEFIKAEEDGQFYFMETAARVAGAHIAEMVEASSGVNLWAEWAKLESLGEGEDYRLPATRKDFSGILITLARQERPDLAAYADPEVVWRLAKGHHAGLIVRSTDFEKVRELLSQYKERFFRDFHASQPLPEKPTA